ncbi:CCAAT/enhancer-binding protein epsilon-like [Heterodontus francisci]|uniref:CCAAT/enhancer-binding protein epsilon-like n=1 Tax=Heterodontus francisci TaxID=7792 RepID=UPI00355BFC15
MSSQGHHLYDCERRPAPPPPGYPSRPSPGEPGTIDDSEASIDLGAYVLDSSEEFLSDLFAKHERLKAEVPPYPYPYHHPAPPPSAYGYPPPLYGTERKVGTGIGGRLAYEAGLSAPAVKEEPREQVGVGISQQQHPRGSESLTFDPLHYQVAHCGQTSMHLTPGLMSATPPVRLYKGPLATSSSGMPSAHMMRDRPLSSSKSKKLVNKDSVEYRLRRERNNIAVRKSRDKAKRRNMETQQKAMQFMSENERLRNKVEQLSQELETLRGLFRQMPEGSGVHQRP